MRPYVMRQAFKARDQRQMFQTCNLFSSIFAPPAAILNRILMKRA